MKTNLKIPHLSKTGISRSKFLTFLEISRHPDGISVGDIAQKIEESPQLVLFVVKSLEKYSYITTVYENRDGRGRKICYATPFAIDNIQKETEAICRLLTAIRKEMAKGA